MENSSGQQIVFQLEPELRGESDYILKRPLDETTRWKHTVKTSMFLEPITLDVESRIAARNATVTVSAGNFEGCIQVVTKGRVVKSLGIYGKAEVGYEESNWYAPKVGLVKSALKEESNNLLVGTGGTVIMELTEMP